MSTPEPACQAAAPQFPPANRPFALPTLEMLHDAALAAARDAIEHEQPILLSRAQLVKLIVDKFDETFAASDRGLAEGASS